MPLGFMSDHMEVLWDLDTEAMDAAAEAGLRAVRTPTPGVDPAFVVGARRSRRGAAARHAGGASARTRPTSDRGSTSAGPACCENVRAGFKPAAAGLAP